MSFLLLLQAYTKKKRAIKKTKTLNIFFLIIIKHFHYTSLRKKKTNKIARYGKNELPTHTQTHKDNGCVNFFSYFRENEMKWNEKKNRTPPKIKILVIDWSNVVVVVVFNDFDDDDDDEMWTSCDYPSYIITIKIQMAMITTKRIIYWWWFEGQKKNW